MDDDLILPAVAFVALSIVAPYVLLVVAVVGLLLIVVAIVSAVARRYERRRWVARELTRTDLARQQAICDVIRVRQDAHRQMRAVVREDVVEGTATEIERW